MKYPYRKTFSPVKISRSFSTSEIPEIPNFSTITLGDRYLGKVGPG